METSLIRWIAEKMWTEMEYKNEINLNLKGAMRSETLKTKWLHSPDKWLLLSFICSVTFDSVTPWTVAHQASCPSLSPGVCSDWCPLSWWCHPTNSSSVTPFNTCIRTLWNYSYACNAICIKNMHLNLSPLMNCPIDIMYVEGQSWNWYYKWSMDYCSSFT